VADAGVGTRSRQARQRPNPHHRAGDYDLPIPSADLMVWGRTARISRTRPEGSCLVAKPNRLAEMALTAVGFVVVIAFIVGFMVGGSWLFGPSGPARDHAVRVEDYSAVCSSGPIRDAAPYDRTRAAAGRIAVFDAPRTDSAGGLQLVHFQDLELNATDVSAVQLVACTTLDKPWFGRDEQVSSCSYQGGTAPMYQGTHTITVYEARTGEQVGEPVTLSGESRDCPYSILHPSTAQPAVYTAPSERQYHTALSSYFF
jgi:hypothetical protein